MKNFIFLAAGIFALGCDDYIFAGLLPGISNSFESSIAGAAQGTTVHEFGYVAALPLCVYLLSKRAVPQILMLALLTFTVGLLITLLSTNLPVHIVGRAITGLGAGLYLPLAIASAGELVDPSAKGRALSLAWGSNSAGAVIGIPIGLWLAEKAGWRASVGMILLLSVIALVGLMSQKLELKVVAPPSLREQLSLLVDRGVMSIIGITLLSTTACLGLYVYTTPILSGSSVSPDFALTLWNIGGLIGTFAVGYFVDRIQNPQWVMAALLTGLMLTLIAIPSMRSVPTLGLLPFLIWGIMGWSTITPQQYLLGQLKPDRDATLVALNSSATCIGTVAGAALGGLALTGGLNAIHLPYLAAALLFCALAWQLVQIQRRTRLESASLDGMDSPKLALGTLESGD